MLVVIGIACGNAVAAMVAALTGAVMAIMGAILPMALLILIVTGGVLTLLPRLSKARAVRTWLPWGAVFQV